MFCVLDKCIWIVCIHLSLLVREHLSSGVNVLRKDLKKIHVSKSNFYSLITFTVIIQADKGALLRLNEIFGAFTMSPVETSSQTGIFRHLSKHVFRGR